MLLNTTDEFYQIVTLWTDRNESYYNSHVVLGMRRLYEFCTVRYGSFYGNGFWEGGVKRSLDLRIEKQTQMYFYPSNTEIEGQEFSLLYEEIKLLRAQFCVLTYGIIRLVGWGNEL